MDTILMQKNLQISFLPYLFLGNNKSIDFAEMNVASFNFISSDRIHDEKLRKHVIKLLATHRRNGTPINGIGIISFRKSELFRPLTEQERQKVDDFRKVLFLTSVAKSNINIGPNMGRFMVTSDNFAALYQNFAVGYNNTAWSSGKIIRMSDSGYKIGKIIFEMPRYIPITPFQYDQGFLKTLSQLNRKKPRKFRLIMRATDSMMNGYSNSDDISFESRILEQARAFEILLELPDSGQRKVFKDKIEKYCEPKVERKIRFKYENRGKHIYEVPPRTRHVMWADRFYTLRNHIIHGNKITAKEFFFAGQPHYHLALWFFLVTAKKIINETLGRPIFNDTIRYEDGKFEYDNNAGNFMAYWEKAGKELSKRIKEQMHISLSKADKKLYT
ncbi:MAG: hypothetical protein AB1306_09540 [Nitrospirota bacterium]